jgi:hypothetical protein
MVERLSEDLLGIVFSYLSKVERHAYISANKYYHSSAKAFRLQLQLSFSRYFCFQCKKEPVAGIFFDDEFIRTSAFCPNHARGTNAVCLTHSHAGRNASFARLTIVYWKNRAGRSENLPT